VRTISEVASLLKLDRDTVIRWSVTFCDYLSRHATPPKGQTRRFTDSDVRVLALVDEHWDMDDDLDPDPERIKTLLEYGGQNDERYADLIYLNSPIFQEPPEDLDETSHHGFLLSSIWNQPLIEVARAYKYAADELVREGLSCQEPHLLDYPILYLYRHTLELYLKLVINDPAKAKAVGHDLGALINEVEKMGQATMAPWIADRLREFHTLDPISDLFRYSDRPPKHPKHAEMWVDLLQLRTLMNQVCEAFEEHIRGVSRRRPNEAGDTEASPPT